MTIRNCAMLEVLTSIAKRTPAFGELDMIIGAGHVMGLEELFKDMTDPPFVLTRKGTCS